MPQVGTAEKPRLGVRGRENSLPLRGGRRRKQAVEEAAELEEERKQWWQSWATGGRGKLKGGKQLKRGAQVAGEAGAEEKAEAAGGERVKKATVVKCREGGRLVP